LNAQRIKPFLGTSVLMNAEYNNSSILNLNGGAEFKVTNYFRPEIEAGFYFGGIREVTSNDEQGFTTSIYDRSMTAFAVSFLPKFIFNRNHELDATFGYFQLFPIYTISNSSAFGNFVVINQENLPISTQEQQTIKAVQHSIGFGIGFLVNLSENNTNSLAINILYQPIDFGKNIEKLKYSTTEFGNKNQVGIGVKFYFGRKIKN
jgi:hypothetical protein